MLNHIFIKQIGLCVLFVCLFHADTHPLDHLLALSHIFPFVLSILTEYDVFVCRSIMTDLYYLSQADGVGEWRMREAKDLSDLVQNRITYLQVSTGLRAAQPAGVHCLSPSPTHADITTRRRLTRPQPLHPRLPHTCSRPYVCFSRASLRLACLTHTLCSWHTLFLQEQGRDLVAVQSCCLCQHYSDTHSVLRNPHPHLLEPWCMPPLGRGHLGSPPPPRVGPPRHRRASSIN